MHGIASLYSSDGGVVLPAQTNHECELVFEHVDAFVKKHGSVRVELNGEEWRVSESAPSGDVRCATCNQPLSSPVYSDRSHQCFCAACVQTKTKAHLPITEKIT